MHFTWFSRRDGFSPTRHQILPSPLRGSGQDTVSSSSSSSSSSKFESNLSGHRCDGVCVRLYCISRYLWCVWDVFFRYSSSLCLKVFTVHWVRPRMFAGRLLKSWGPLIWKLPSLIVLIVPVTRRFIWGILQSRPCRVDMRVSMPTFGAMPSIIFQT